MSPEWLKQAKKYLRFERNEEHLAHVKRLVEDHNEDELRRLFGKRLTFGTAGLRGRMGAGYAQMNDLVVIQTSQGLARYLVAVHGEKLLRERGVILGHDARHNSARYARLAALAFLQLQVPVYYCDHIVPTPLVAFGVGLFNCLAGIMVTASHNPKQDNGYKVYWSNGAQILSPHDEEIQRSIEQPENQEPWARAWAHECLELPGSEPLDPFGSHASAASLEPSLQQQPQQQQQSSNLDVASSQQEEQQQEQQEPMPEDFKRLLHRIHGQLSKSYFAYLQQLVGERQAANRESSLRIAYTAMHGVGHAYLSRALALAGFQERSALHPVHAQKKPDPEFPTVRFPNPEEAGALDFAFETAAHTQSQLILANDPDADRCAAALYEPETRRRRILTGNELGALLGWWIWHTHSASASGGGLASSAVPPSDASDDLTPAGASSAHQPDGSGGAQQQTARRTKPEDCYMLSTAVSSRFLRSMAQKEGFQFVETLTGFKYMGNVAHELIHKRNKRVLFAYEEAIGYMVDAQILDKDGISAALQLAQCAAYLRAAHKRTLEDQLHWLHVRYGYHYSLNSYYICQEARTIQAIFHHLQSDYPKHFGATDRPEPEFVVTRVRDLNNGIDNGEPRHRATLPVSASSFMVTFFVNSGEIHFTIRTSGTEPKIKYYSEIVAQLPTTADTNDGQTLEAAQERAKSEAQARLRRFVAAAIERCLRPAHYNLEPAAGSSP